LRIRSTQSTVALASEAGSTVPCHPVGEKPAICSTDGPTIDQVGYDEGGRRAPHVMPLADLPALPVTAR